MTLNVLGAQATVSGTLTLPASTTVSGEITVLTTAPAPDYTAIVTLSLAASGQGYAPSGSFVLPGNGGGAGASGGTYLTTCHGAGVAMTSYGNTMHPSYGASATLKVGPATPIKIPYCFTVFTAGAIVYTINAHVAYVKNP